MSARRINLLRFFNALGAAVSLYLVQQHIQFAVNGGLEGGFCRVFKLFDCEAAERSMFSSIFGIPTASFGLYYFTLFLVMAFMAKSDGTGGRFEPVASLMSLTGLLVSLALALISALVVRGFCAGCTAVYFVTLANAIILMRGGPTEYVASAIGGFASAGSLFKEMFGDIPVASAAGRKRAFLILFFVAAPVEIALPPFYIHRSHSHGLIDGYMKMPVVQFEVGERAIARGSADAPVQIVVFTDFDCPYCKKFEPVLRKALEKYPGEKYRLIYKMYPLGKCNPIMKGQKGEHKNACRLAEMAQALGAMGKFWEAGENLHELAGRAELYPGLKDLAAKGGFDYLQWVAKLDDPAIREQVNRDIMEGVKLQIIALPAIFINGRYVKSLEPNNFDLLLKYIFDSAAK